MDRFDENDLAEANEAKLALVPAVDYADYGPELYGATDEDTEPAPAITATYFEAKPYLAIDAYLEAGVLNLIASIDEAITLRDAIDKALTDAGYVTD